MKMWIGLAVTAALGLGALLCAAPARADVASDQPAAILVFPKVVTGDVTIGSGVFSAVLKSDTIIQISNTSSDPVTLQCFYVNANSHCSTSGLVCNPLVTPACPAPEDVCLPGWVETDFRVVLTPFQPLGWTVSSGLASEDLPLDGVLQRGPTGQSNVGTRVPPLRAEPASVGVLGQIDDGRSVKGELKCVVVDDQGNAVARNVVKGEATIISSLSVLTSIGAGADVQIPNAERYNAVGIQASGGDANGDKVLDLGGTAGEYNGCANVLIMDHFFDYSPNPVANTQVFSDLTLVPCSENLRTQVPQQVVAQYLVFNEFEQRFSTSTPFQCYFDRPLSRIDTSNAARSVFSVFVSGTLTGQTRIRGIGSGLVGVLRERQVGIPDEADSVLTETTSAADAVASFDGTLLDMERDVPGFGSVFNAAFRSSMINLHIQGDRPEADHLVLP